MHPFTPASTLHSKMPPNIISTIQEYGHHKTGPFSHKSRGGKERVRPGHWLEPMLPICKKNRDRCIWGHFSGRQHTLKYFVDRCSQPLWFLVWPHLSTLTAQRPATLYWRFQWNPSCTRLETPTWLTTSNLAQASGVGHGATCERSLDHSHEAVNVEVATSLRWSYAAVSEWDVTPFGNKS